jgi:putative transposase
MTKNYKSKQPGIPYFLTFTIVKWINVFTKPEYCHILWDSLQYCRKEKGMKLYAFVFMTNHIYLNWGIYQSPPLFSFKLSPQYRFMTHGLF